MIARLVGMQPRGVFRRSLPLALAVVTLGLAACGSDDESASGRDGRGEPAADGREIAEDRGCMSCHRDGGGGIGPDWEGLAGSTVTLDDRSTVVADEAYLSRAITDPDAQIVDGFDVRMPSSDIDDDDVAAIVAYIKSLGATQETEPS